MSLSDFPLGPATPSRRSGGSPCGSRPAGDPVLPQVSFCEHADTTTPADSPCSCARFTQGDGSLPHPLTGSASALDGFGTCSVFIFITACSLADPPFSETFYIRGFVGFVTSTNAPTATGWSDSCRVGFILSHWSPAPFSRRTGGGSVRESGRAVRLKAHINREVKVLSGQNTGCP